MINHERNFYIWGLQEHDARCLLYNMVLDSCGIDLTEGVTINGNESQFVLGKKAVALNIHNKLVEYNGEALKKMKTEKEGYDRRD